ncbi:hypothetical protein DICPUDRAFT_55765 [Dictyostelium purpureum]|uniref:SCP2 domain-containing protein n=1 Tax=Dictyostelium purpureum TaxID=5786 RepID=F0ZNH2_DICPU|nr:uncharacterized protein DICPUDRAFT_55765 [Dictyostelium purpureum]EGC34515.1 hypothetical protein DICPUDRAFT_55765 [Dictyostelium purpureum]|eukprot:XP_003288951.1 hypothetical protein DICPUDRAFT_55765 [Dictyostelium purpureum]
MASKFFSTLESVIKTDGAALVKKINGVYQFDIDGTSYSVDLKNGNGSFKVGKHEKPECTITIKEEDFIQILEGKLTEQTAFMKKKLALKGNMALAMKFKHIVEAVKKASKGAAPAASSGASSGASLDDGTPLGKVFDTLQKTVIAKPELVGQIKGVYQFDITTPSGVKKFTVDLKNGKGSVTTGAAPKADCTITMAEADFLDLMSGKLNGQVAFTKGKLKIKGNMGLAMKLGKITQAKPQAKL